MHLLIPDKLLRKNEKFWVSVANGASIKAKEECYDYLPVNIFVRNFLPSLKWRYKSLPCCKVWKGTYPCQLRNFFF